MDMHDSKPEVGKRVSKSLSIVAQKFDANIIVFVVHDVKCCLKLDWVARVVLLAALDPVPLGPPYLRGLLSVAGQEVPVIDLAERLLMEGRRPYNLGTPIMLCSHADKCVGVIVSSMLGTAVADQESLQLSGMFPPFLGGFDTDHGHALLLDGDWLLTIDLPIPEQPLPEQPLPGTPLSVGHPDVPPADLTPLNEEPPLEPEVAP